MDLTVGFMPGESPFSNEEHIFEDWSVLFKKSHILPSKCTEPCDASEACFYCGFTKQLHLEHLPEMVFPQNILKLKHKSGSSIEFNALEALRHVKTTREESFTIASAQAWRKAREDTGLVDKTVGNFDWTFRSNYGGTFEGWPPPEKTTVGIDTERLKQREKILFYRELVLYEDELHDNGISLSNVRIRVMGWGFFILLRHFLRVDGVALCATDTRICHDFSTHFVTVEHSSRQGSIPELRLPLSVIKEPDEVSPLLPLTSSSIEKYHLPNF
ncbi:TIP41-like protein [Halyomorpha halys]|uniref:TIP41-like protein n=1 Tax=Halyomorpha halys TaxID=286706 RepID=UPI0006D4FD80|nr:TIP41-like protein [Halyomorpha halys]XP_014288985.1 TIP41-like protein [Halyomorpha halys]